MQDSVVQSLGKACCSTGSILSLLRPAAIQICGDCSETSGKRFVSFAGCSVVEILCSTTELNASPQPAVIEYETKADLGLCKRIAGFVTVPTSIPTGTSTLADTFCSFILLHKLASLQSSLEYDE